MNSLTRPDVAWCILVVVLAGCEPVENAGRNLDAGPLVYVTTGDDEPSWCETLVLDGASATSEDCVFKYLADGITAHWPALATVAFIADVAPDCRGQNESICNEQDESDCLEICRFTFKAVGEILWGSPEEIDILASLGVETVYEDDKPEEAYRINGSYPSNLWIVSPGRNLIFANKSCLSGGVVDGRTLYLIAGMYPTEGEQVFDLDEVEIPLVSLVNSVVDSGVIVNEDERYQQACHLNAYLRVPGDGNASGKTTGDIPMIPRYN